MFKKLLRPQVDLAALLLRSGLAAIFIVHGIIKVVQEQQMRREMSLALQSAVGWIELICGCLLALGLSSRLAALALIPVQVGAMIMITGKDALQGISFKITGADYSKVGPEFNLVLIVMCLSVVVLGSGSCSLDHWLQTWWCRRKPQPQPQAQPEAVAS